MQDINSLSHSKWNCKYHIVFAPKYRRKVFFEGNRRDILCILGELCKWKDVQIITAEACSNHIHMFLAILPKYSISSFMGYLKGKSSVMIYEKWGIENKLHFYLDTVFMEDKNSCFVENTQKNLNILRKFCLSILKMFKKKTKLSMNNIRFNISMDFEYEIEKILKSLYE